jgi:hypothetical protein
MKLPRRSLTVLLFSTAILALASVSAKAATLIVANTNDAGADSLRATVAAAIADDTIKFNIPTSDPGYNSSTGVFTITLTSGEIVIDRDLTIAGPAAANIAISGNHASRIFNIAAGTVEIFNLSLVNGQAKGADGSPVGGDGEANGRPGVGGAVLNQGTLTFERCTFAGNTALGGVGASRNVIAGGSGGDGQGGAIANQGTLSLVACTLAANSGIGGTSGIGGFEIQFSAPGGKGSGGGIYNASAATLSLSNCTMTDNTARGADVAYRPPFGSEGAAGQGGGVANLGTLAIANCTLANNKAIGGDSIENPGVAFYAGASFGGGLYGATGSSSSMRDTIFAPNTVIGGAAGGPPGVGVTTGPDVNGAVISQGHNLLGRSDGCTGFTSDDQQGGTTDPTRLDPKLGALGHYGGPTETLPLLPGSPAIDGGSTAAFARDQRYFVRTGPPDIGAFEFQGTQPVLLANISTRLRVQTGDNAVIGGFIVTGTEPKTVIVRGLGPSLSLPGALTDPVIEVHGSAGELLAMNDNWRDATTSQDIIGSGLAPGNDLESSFWGILNPGAYTVVVRGKNNATGIALFEVYDLDQTVDSKLANVSTRGFVETGDNVMIGGTIITGSPPARMLFRAIGPSLTNSGVPNPLADPVLELYDGNGGLIAIDYDWRDTQEAEIIATGIPPTSDLESAIVRDLPPGNYTAIVHGVNNATGVALVEIYNLN